MEWKHDIKPTLKNEAKVETNCRQSDRTASSRLPKCEVVSPFYFDSAVSNLCRIHERGFTKWLSWIGFVILWVYVQL